MQKIVFPIERIPKRRTGDIGNVEHLQRILTDSFNKFSIFYISKMVFKMAAKMSKFSNVLTIISSERKRNV